MRTDPFEAKKYEELSIKTAKELASYLERWEKYAGTEAGRHRQLKAQLARFLKKCRKGKTMRCKPCDCTA